MNITEKLMERLKEKKERAELHLGKFSNDMISSGKPIDRINAAMARQDIRAYDSCIELIDELLNTK